MQFRERKSLHLFLKLLPAHESCWFMLASKHKRAVEVAGMGESGHSARSKECPVCGQSGFLYSISKVCFC